MTPYETRGMRELAALRMVWESAAWPATWMAVEMLWTNVVREEGAGGRAALAGPRAVGGAGEARLWRARRRRMVMKYVAALGASAPVDVSAARSEVCKKRSNNLLRAPTRPGGENREEGKTEFICVIAKDGDTCRKFVLHVILESL